MPRITIIAVIDGEICRPEMAAWAAISEVAMRVREVLFSTSLRAIDLARWCANHLTGHGEDKFYLRWNPDTRDYAVSVYKARDLKNIRNNDGLMVVRLASRDLSNPAPRGGRRDRVPSPTRPALEPVP